MTLQTKKNVNFDNLKDIFLFDGSKKTSILFGGNLDLYWIITDSSINEADATIEFEVTKQSMNVFLQLEQLFENIKNINIFDEEKMGLLPIDCVIDYEEERILYKERNLAYYNELYQPNLITWYSDETNMVVANYLQIKRRKDSFLLSFHTQPYIEGYGSENNIHGIISIRFSMSGSRYSPFNCLFQKMYNFLQQVDDTYDINHQIHIE